jgi:hypothetical protein
VSSLPTGPLALSLQVATLATLLALVAGLPLAWILARRTFPGRDLLGVLVLLPMVLPPTVLGYYLLLVVGREGPVGRVWEAAGLGRIVFTPTAAVLAAFVAALPFLVRAAQGGFEQVDATYEEAAAPWDGESWGSSSPSPSPWRGEGSWRGRPGLRPGRGGVRGHPHGGGKHPGADPDGQHRHLRRGPGRSLEEAHLLALLLSLMAGASSSSWVAPGEGRPLVSLSVSLRGGRGLPPGRILPRPAGDHRPLRTLRRREELTLRCIAGLSTPDAGRIVLEGPSSWTGRAGVDLPTRSRRLGVPLPAPALFPHLDVSGNVAFGIHRLPREERTARVEELLALVGLEGFGARRWPASPGGSSSGWPWPGPWPPATPPPPGRALLRPGHGDPLPPPGRARRPPPEDRCSHGPGDPRPRGGPAPGRVGGPLPGGPRGGRGASGGDPGWSARVHGPLTPPRPTPSGPTAEDQGSGGSPFPPFRSLPLCSRPPGLQRTRDPLNFVFLAACARS